MSRKQQSVVCLDPIDRTRKKQDSVFGRLLKTRPHGGKPVKKTAEIGHYLFCGKQRQGKTVSMLWYAEVLQSKWERKGCKVKFYSNMDIGEPITKMNFLSTMQSNPITFPLPFNYIKRFQRVYLQVGI